MIILYVFAIIVGVSILFQLSTVALGVSVLFVEWVKEKWFDWVYRTE